MDEIKLVGDLFAEPAPPSPEVIAAARARLPLNRPPRRSRRRARLRITLPVAAVAAVAVAVTAVVVSSGPQAPKQRTPGQRTPGPGVFHLPSGARAQAGSAAAGRRVLLTVADTAAQSPAPTRVAPGRHFLMLTQAGNFLVVGPAKDPYVILERANNQDWAGSSFKIMTAGFTQLPGAEFASAADEAAWRRDGSPAKWDVTADTSVADPHGAANGFNSDITTTPGQLIEDTDPLSGFNFGSHYFLTPAQLLRLPADPARLKKMLLAGYLRGTEGQGVNAEVYLFEMTPRVLTLPITPAVRSALYRMLADLPGVRSVGQVQDVAGQYGEAVALDRHYAQCGSESVKYRNGGVNSFVPAFRSCVVEQRLVINPRNGLPLALELRYVKQPGARKWPGPNGLFSYELFQRAYWTNAPLPAAPGRP